MESQKQTDVRHFHWGKHLTDNHLNLLNESAYFYFLSFFVSMPERGAKQTIPQKTVGFIPWEFIEKPWDCSVLFFGAPTLHKLQY